MGMKTWKIGAKAAGTHVGGRVVVANRFGELDASGRELGQAVVAGLNRAARKCRLFSMKQPETGEVAEDKNLQRLAEEPNFLTPSRGTHTVARNPKLRLTQLEVVGVVDASSRADSALRRVGPAEIRQLRSAIS